MLFISVNDRTSTGQLTELDPSTLQPRGRFGRSTTTRGPRTNALTQALLVCDLDVSPCEVTPVGGNWTVGSSDSECCGGNFFVWVLFLLSPKRFYATGP